MCIVIFEKLQKNCLINVKNEFIIISQLWSNESFYQISEREIVKYKPQKIKIGQSKFNYSE